MTNWLAGLLTALAIAFYVIVYTMLLKRRTAQNIVWGGAAGCMPVLIGWAAVTGGLDWAPVALFAVVFFWTPPHFWALAIRYRDDYERAGIPMLPVVATPMRVARDIVGYAWLTVAASLAVWPLGAGWLYGVLAARRRRGAAGCRPPAVRAGQGRSGRQGDGAVPPVEQLPGVPLRRGRRRHLRPHDRYRTFVRTATGSVSSSRRASAGRDVDREAHRRGHRQRVGAGAAAERLGRGTADGDGAGRDVGRHLEDVADLGRVGRDVLRRDRRAARSG